MKFLVFSHMRERAATLSPLAPFNHLSRLTSFAPWESRREIAMKTGNRIRLLHPSAQRVQSAFADFRILFPRKAFLNIKHGPCYFLWKIRFYCGPLLYRWSLKTRNGWSHERMYRAEIWSDKAYIHTNHYFVSSECEQHQEDSTMKVPFRRFYRIPAWRNLTCDPNRAG